MTFESQSGIDRRTFLGNGLVKTFLEAKRKLLGGDAQTQTASLLSFASQNKDSRLTWSAGACYAATEGEAADGSQ
jgi:hypothetical protein